MPKANFKQEIEGHYRKYDEIIREKRDEYRRKRDVFENPISYNQEHR